MEREASGERPIARLKASRSDRRCSAGKPHMIRTRWSGPLLLVLALGIPFAGGMLRQLSAQQARIDPALYGGLRWRSIGPFRGGRVNGVSGVPGQPNTFYFGSVGGGVWERAM